MPQNRYRSLVAMARIREAEGDVAAAVDLLDEAERVYVGDFFPDVRPVAAVRARSYLLLRRRWVKHSRGHGSAVFLRKTISATCASSSTSRWRGSSWRFTGPSAPSPPCKTRSHCWTGSWRTRRPGAGPERSSRSWSCRRSRARRSETCASALVSLERAVGLAEPEGYVRIFLDEGAPMDSLLRSARRSSLRGELRRRESWRARARPTASALRSSRCATR